MTNFDDYIEKIINDDSYKKKYPYIHCFILKGPNIINILDKISQLIKDEKGFIVYYSRMSLFDINTTIIIIEEN